MDDTLTDELLNAVTWRIPNALVLVGSRHGDEWNAMTASWVTQVSMEPVLIGIGVDNKAVTHRLDQRLRGVHRQPLVIRGHPGVRQVLQAGEDTRTASSTSGRFAPAKPEHRSSTRRSPGWSAR